jgi:LmbE family N-acetylglucosaminyl deacetylase/glycosyltransferase involved in cell wall biosynthesis
VKPRLLVVTRERHADRRYGLGKSLLPILAVFEQSGVEFRYLCQEDAGERSWRTLRRLHAWTAPLAARILRGSDAAALLWGLIERFNVGRVAAKVASREGFTHVHCHDPFIALGFRFCVRLFGRGGRLRWGVSEHGFGCYVQALHEDGARLGSHATRFLRAREAAVLRVADWVVAPTLASLRQLSRDLGLPGLPGHWHAIPHAVPCFPELSRDAARRRLGWPDDALIVLAVGRLVPLKNFDALISAFALLLRRSPGVDARLVILGDGEAEPYVSLAARLGMQERVTISTTDEIWVHYAAADLYVSTSRTESFGMANLEAIRSGLPSICTAVGGVPEVVGDAAVLVPADDGQALADALSWLSGCRHARERFRQAAQARGRAWPSAEAIAEAYLGIYRGESVPQGVAAYLRNPNVVANDAQSAVGEPHFRPITPLEPAANLRVVVFAPHADDEVLGCGGTLARLSRAGGHIFVVIVSDGCRGDPAGYSNGDVVEVRRAEARRAAHLLGADEPIFLDFPDGELVADESLESEFMARIRDLRPDWVFVPSPDDAHRDHVAVAKAALRAVERSAPSSRVFAYETWTPVPANRLFDVSETFDRKLDALGAYALPLRYVNYRDAVIGLGRYRALHLPSAMGYAEAFMELRGRLQ